MSCYLRFCHIGYRHLVIEKHEESYSNVSEKRHVFSIWSSRYHIFQYAQAGPLFLNLNIIHSATNKHPILAPTKPKISCHTKMPTLRNLTEQLHGESNIFFQWVETLSKLNTGKTARSRAEWLCQIWRVGYVWTIRRNITKVLSPGCRTSTRNCGNNCSWAFKCRYQFCSSICPERFLTGRGT